LTKLKGSWDVIEIKGRWDFEVAGLMQIDAVILDYGQVLSLRPRPRDFETLQRTSGIDSSTFPEVFWQHRDAYDCGLLDGPAFWALVARDAHTSFTPRQIEQLIALDIQLWVHPNPVMLEWIRLLGPRGVRTAVLSNMPLDHSRYLHQNAAWLRAFDHLCFSGELGLGKPDAAIYRSCLAGLQVPASQAVFIDDREVNVLGARAVGLHGVGFEAVDQLAKDLEPFGLAESFAEAVGRAG
jgi:putative hydrolase of the HAD superfamily